MTSTTANGYFSYGKLYQHSSGLFYGLTRLGGTNSDGVFFRFDDATATYSVDLPSIIRMRLWAAIPTATWRWEQMESYTVRPSRPGSGSANGTIFNFDISTSAYTRVRTFSGIVPERAPSRDPDFGQLQWQNLRNLFNRRFRRPRYFLELRTFHYDFYHHSLRFLQYGARPNGQLMKAANGLLYGMTSEGGNNRSG